MISDEQFPTSFPTKGTSQKEILYNKRKQLKLEGSFNFFFIFRFLLLLEGFWLFHVANDHLQRDNHFVMSCLRVAEVEREQPGACGNRRNLQEGQEFAEIWPFWRIKHPHQSYGDLEGFSFILSNLNKVLGYTWKTLCRSLKFWGYFFLGGVGWASYD